MELKNKKIYLQSKLPMPSEYFVGRQEEIEKIHNYFQSGEQVVVLQGIGGIGKSEIAKRYAIQYQEEYDTIVFAHCYSGLKALITNDEEIPVIGVQRKVLDDESLEEEDDYFERKLRILEHITSDNTLIIVDNFNQRNDLNLFEFLSGPYKVLFTSRNNWTKSNYSTVPITEIQDMKLLKQLFYNYYPQAKGNLSEEKVITEIINTISGHTLMLEWLAKQLASGMITPEQMLQRLKNRGILTARIKRSDGKAGPVLIKAGASKQLKNVFNVKELGELEQEVLMCMTLVPYSGVSKELLITKGKRGYHTAVLNLLRNSWIQQRDLDLIALHPVIAEIVRAELKPDWDKCDTFIQSIRNDIISKETSNQKLIKLMPIAEHILDVLGVKTEKSVDFLLDLSEIFEARYRDLALSIGVVEKALEVQKKIASKINAKVVTCQKADLFDIEYNQLKSDLYNADRKVCIAIQRLARIYYNQGKYEEALEYLQSLMREPRIIDSSCDIAKIYYKKEDYEKAIEVVEEGVQFRIKKYGKKTTKLIENYQLLACIYSDMGDEYTAFAYMEEGKLLSEQSELPLEKAEFYVAYAKFLKERENYLESIEYEQKASEIYQSEFGENNMETVSCYAAISVAFYRLGEYEKTLEYTLKEISMRKKLDRMKLKLYMVVSRLLLLIKDVESLDEHLKIELSQTVSDFNKLSRRYPEEALELLQQ